MKNDNTAKISIDSILRLNTAKDAMVKILDEYSKKSSAASKGRIFGLVESRNPAALNAEVLNILDICIDSYLKAAFSTDKSFDALIMELNARLGSLTEISREKFNIIIGAVETANIHFTFSGDIIGYLYSARGIKRITDGEGTGGTAFFQSSFCGDFLDGYVLYFCNKNFDDCFAPYNLGRALKKYGAPTVTKSIKEHIFNVPEADMAAAIFIYRTECQKNDTADSVAGLFASQNRTLDQISPSIFSEIKLMLRDRVSARAAFQRIFSKTIRIAALLARFIIAFFIFLFYFISNLRGGREKQWQLLKTTARQIKIKIFSLYNALPNATKIILGFLLIASLFLSGGVFYSFNNKKQERLRNIYAVKVESAQKLKNEAEAHLLFGEKRQAAKKMWETIAALDAAPEKLRDKAFAELYLNSKIILYSIQNISEISSPVALADLSNNAENFNGPLYVFGDSLVFLTGAETIKIRPNQTLERYPLKINVSSNELSVWNDEDKKIYNFSGGGALQVADPSQLASESKEIILENDEEPAGLRIWNGKAYVISYNNERFTIWKHNPSLSGFGRPNLLLADKVPHGAKPVSFDIDGNLYILFSNNELKKYYKGAAINWNFSAENLPQGASYNKIFAGEHYNNLYLVGWQSVAILSKNGDSLSHLIFPSLNIQNAAVDEKNKTLYILANKKIYAVTY